MPYLRVATLCFGLVLFGCPTVSPVADAVIPADGGSDAGDGSRLDGMVDSDGSLTDTGTEDEGSAGDSGVPLLGCARLESLSGSLLYSEVFELVDGHTFLSYDRAREVMYGVEGNVDVVDGVIESIYTGATVEPDGSRAPGAFNTEHSWPRSQGANGSPAVSDMHHLFPCDEGSNNSRSTFPFGNTNCDETGTCSFSAGGSELGLDAAGNEVFEVRPQRRGDIARALFYFSIRYSQGIGEAEEQVLRAWHEEDPPDDAEVARNTRIEAYQDKRNPFVDCPGAVLGVDNF